MKLLDKEGLNLYYQKSQAHNGYWEAGEEVKEGDVRFLVGKDNTQYMIECVKGGETGDVAPVIDDSYREIGTFNVAYKEAQELESVVADLKEAIDEAVEAADGIQDAKEAAQEAAELAAEAVATAQEAVSTIKENADKAVQAADEAKGVQADLDEVVADVRAKSIQVKENLISAQAAANTANADKNEIASLIDGAAEAAQTATTAAATATSKATQADNAVAKAKASKESAEETAAALIEFLNTKETLEAPAVDKVLAVEGAAADAKATGIIKKDVNYYLEKATGLIPLEWENGGITIAAGENQTANYLRSNFVPATTEDVFSISGAENYDNVYIYYYADNADKTALPIAYRGITKGNTTTTEYTQTKETIFTVPEGANYFRVRLCKKDGSLAVGNPMAFVFRKTSPYVTADIFNMREELELQKEREANFGVCELPLQWHRSSDTTIISERRPVPKEGFSVINFKDKNVYGRVRFYKRDERGVFVNVTKDVNHPEIGTLPLGVVKTAFAGYFPYMKDLYFDVRVYKADGLDVADAPFAHVFTGKVKGNLTSVKCGAATKTSSTTDYPYATLAYRVVVPVRLANKIVCSATYAMNYTIRRNMSDGTEEFIYRGTNTVGAQAVGPSNFTLYTHNIIDLTQYPQDCYCYVDVRRLSNYSQWDEDQKLKGSSYYRLSSLGAVDDVKNNVYIDWKVDSNTSCDCSNRIIMQNLSLLKSYKYKTKAFTYAGKTKDIKFNPNANMAGAIYNGNQYRRTNLINISPYTLACAAANPNSLYYDGVGNGYGSVCSSFVSGLCGWDYSRLVVNFAHGGDENVPAIRGAVKTPWAEMSVEDLKAGDILIKEVAATGHAILITGKSYVDGVLLCVDYAESSTPWNRMNREWCDSVYSGDKKPFDGYTWHIRIDEKYTYPLSKKFNWVAQDDYEKNIMCGLGTNGVYSGLYSSKILLSIKPDTVGWIDIYRDGEQVCSLNLADLTPTVRNGYNVYDIAEYCLHKEGYYIVEGDEGTVESFYVAPEYTYEYTEGKGFTFSDGFTINNKNIRQICLNYKIDGKAYNVTYNAEDVLNNMKVNDGCFLPPATVTFKYADGCTKVGELAGTMIIVFLVGDYDHGYGTSYLKVALTDEIIEDVEDNYNAYDDEAGSSSSDAEDVEEDIVIDDNQQESTDQD